MPTPATYRLLLGEVVAQNYDLPVVAARVVKILLVEWCPFIPQLELFFKDFAPCEGEIGYPHTYPHGGDRW